ncbi:hypothetical protein [Caproicibacter fermentans]|uniref:Uncharacterized protein n=1 Tax=Caproicibacter fermentans TaxID=2576756 RepID=A0A7G8TD83_9FIRM|nr:hypothetical protein [Caproicibacter fermentans]QNK41574.1 hypothetical protein HCR03_04735 [Caproicibacter fermentans]
MPFDQGQLSPSEILVSLRHEILYLPSQWLIRNGLKPGESVLYLTATEKGFYILARPEFPAK